MKDATVEKLQAIAGSIGQARLALVIGLIWVLLFAAPLTRTVHALWHNAGTLIGAYGGYAEAWRTPRSGESALPHIALEIVHLLRRAGATTFQYSPGVAADELIRQRVIEGAWPIRFDARSQIMVALKDEDVGCPVIYTTKEAILVRCD